MQTIAGWHIEMEFKEVEKETRAAAMVRLPDGTEMRARGHATRHPHDAEQLRVGEEIAAARALNELSRELLHKAEGEIEQVTHREAHLQM
ncbi:DUF1876 domain-containing protein [Streptantibioticus rubrisoli]|uniref:DUF1876 domain-containing protein n=1 Tax=Streptantibioticus rubrisoli TaxID=1387313 RepID=A0ABT1PE46_9ACTN|nr:DUF1876 domain-containing protein [Streptantibioticus rubrisoli]MCQ4042600.1 DUF1876 domain-containing protein [Streptantibioticus rubrisoli]